MADLGIMCFLLRGHGAILPNGTHSVLVERHNDDGGTRVPPQDHPLLLITCDLSLTLVSSEEPK